MNSEASNTAILLETFTRNKRSISWQRGMRAGRGAPNRHSSSPALGHRSLEFDRPLRAAAFALERDDRPILESGSGSGSKAGRCVEWSQECSCDSIRRSYPGRCTDQKLELPAL